jgi:hypothetical protein
MSIIALTMPFGGFVAFYYKEYGMTKINDDQFLTILGSCASVVNGLSRLFWGTLIDRVIIYYLYGVIKLFRFHLKQFQQS